MNINFHYFAMKTLTHYAGFKEEQAQQIAKYSQFIDDCHWLPYMNCSNIPKEIVESKTLDLYAPSYLNNFNPSATGFVNPFGYATLVIRKEQKFILSPFHFTPYDRVMAGIETFRVVPLQYGDNSLIDELLQNVIKSYLSGEKWNIELMKMGMLLHIFADTHAHQMFSGFNSWVNKIKIIEVKNNITNKDVTNLILTGIKEVFRGANKSIPAIGHAQVGQSPDLSNVSFSFAYKRSKNDNYSGYYNRNNTETFLEASRHVYNYLEKCNSNLSSSNLSIPDNRYSWDELSSKLRQGFLVEMPKKDIVKKLAMHWNSIFPDVNYHYDSSEIKKHFQLNPNITTEVIMNALTDYTDEFYHYNILANSILAILYGSKSRKSFIHPSA